MIEKKGNTMTLSFPGESAPYTAARDRLPRQESNCAERPRRSPPLPLDHGPCPSCVALLDQLEGAAGHIGQRVDLAVVARASIARLLDFGRERGWQRLRLLSSAANSCNRDYLGETDDGALGASERRVQNGRRDTGCGLAA